MICFFFNNKEKYAFISLKGRNYIRIKNGNFPILRYDNFFNTISKIPDFPNYFNGVNGRL